VGKRKPLWDDDDVTVLTVRKKKLTELPPNIVELRSLGGLYLGDNRFESLPRVLGELPALRALEIAGNPIEAIPESLADRLSLTELDASRTKLRALPSAASSWPLSGITLASMPDDFDFDGAFRILAGCTSLVRLTIGKNALGALPESLFSLRSLKLLHLNECGLREVPEAITTLGDLAKVSFFGNEITELPDAIATMPKLRSLVVSKNPGTRRIKARFRKLGFTGELS
jgi:internalin A